MDGVVYVGSLTGDLVGPRPRDRQAALEVRDGQFDRRVVAGGRGRHGLRRRRRRRRPRRAGARRQPALDVQDRARRSSRRRSSSGSIVLVGSYDGFLYALDAATGKLQWKFETDRPGARDAGRARTASSIIAGCDESFRGVSLADGKELFEIVRRRQHRRRRRSSTATAPTSAPSTTKCWRSTSRRKKIRLALREPRAAVSVLLVGGARRRPRDRRQPRQARARDRRGDRQGGLDVHHAGARRLVAGRRGRPRLRRLERRPPLRARRGDAARSSGSSMPAPRSPRRRRSPRAGS